MNDEGDAAAKAIDHQIKVAEAIRKQLGSLAKVYGFALMGGFLLLSVLAGLLGWMETRWFDPRWVSVVRPGSGDIETLYHVSWPASALMWAAAVAFTAAVIAGAALLGAGYLALGRMLRDD